MLHRIGTALAKARWTRWTENMDTTSAMVSICRLLESLF
jgi:hypothetical protein